MYLDFFFSLHNTPCPTCVLALQAVVLSSPHSHISLLPVCLRIQLRGLPWGSGGLRVCLPAQGTWVQCLVPEDSTSPVPQLLSLHATTIETQAPWSPCSETRGHQNEKPAPLKKSGPCLTQLEKPAQSNRDPAQPKLNKYILEKKDYN